jgi:phosphate transport system permease protein
MTHTDIALQAAAPEPAPEPVPELDFDKPRRPAKGHTTDRALLAGSGVASLAFTWLVFGKLLPLNGHVGFLVVWWLTFVAVYAGLSALTERRVDVVSRIVVTLITTGAAVLAVALTTTILFTFIHGLAALSHFNFYIHDMSGVSPTDGLNRGCIFHAIIGSLIEVAMAVAVALPLGIGTAVYMSEVGGRGAAIVRTVVEAMTALPSIVAGLFVYTVLVVTLQIPRSGFSAAMAIMVMMLPIIARSAYVVMQVTPGGLREASLALGASRWQTVRLIVLPTVRPGLATAVILGVARGIGETSPVLLTSGASTFFNAKPLQDPMNSLPLFVFTSVRSGENLSISRGFGAASVLLIIVLTLFGVTRYLVRHRGERS